jgi:hypothetical protein
MTERVCLTLLKCLGFGVVLESINGVRKLWPESSSRLLFVLYSMYAYSSHNLGCICRHGASKHLRKFQRNMLTTSNLIAGMKSENCSDQDLLDQTTRDTIISAIWMNLSQSYYHLYPRIACFDLKWGKLMLFHLCQENRGPPANGWCCRTVTASDRDRHEVSLPELKVSTNLKMLLKSSVQM